MTPGRKRAAALIAVSVVLIVVASCSSQSGSQTAQSPDTIVSSTPPFRTKEPERYHAVRTITTVTAAGETHVTKTSVARDGESRRNESETVYLDVPEGKYVLLPGKKVYADLTDQSRISADQDEEGLNASPDALLQNDVGSTSYQKLGSEVIAGRKANKYRIVVNSSATANVSQSETVMWIDEALQMPVRSETKSADGTRVTMELSEIRLEVDKNLFTIPGDYKKLAFSELRKRLTTP
jgi:outer membrane lipoprotein-sorting protein